MALSRDKLAAYLKARRAERTAGATSATTQHDQGWKPVGASDPSQLDIDAYRSFLTIRFPLGRSARDREMRYEACRGRVAAMINAARDKDQGALSKHHLDVWIGQRLECGSYLDEMFVTIAGLPTRGFSLFERLAPGASSVHVGRHPVVDGAFPEVHVAGGTVASKWRLNQRLMAVFSRRFRDHHQLTVRALDPYRQLARGADMPVDFPWATRSSRGRRS